MYSDRRAFLALSGSALAAIWLAADPEEVRAALRHAQSAASRSPNAWQYLTPEQAADVEAIASQIIPTDDTPGAKEAGVVYFADQSLATWAAAQREPFTSGLNDLNQQVARRSPGTTRFAALPAGQQTALLHEVEKTPFFQMMRAMTFQGFFGNPEYGGNRDKAGWRLIGFDDRYAWQPPFGDYDAEVVTGGRQ
ncbi:MAG: gluconate 2-dehydrogenase subunit 3 family protein [Gemmatimonadetes bacterium]|nr:gluconate 2-dehydrogenase subunit 3 family protein [Gemmatimonadota bacterium]